MLPFPEASNKAKKAMGGKRNKEAAAKKKIVADRIKKTETRTRGAAAG